jgi:hypothetical protein
LFLSSGFSLEIPLCSSKLVFLVIFHFSLSFNGTVKINKQYLGRSHIKNYSHICNFPSGTNKAIYTVNPFLMVMSLTRLYWYISHLWPITSAIIPSRAGHKNKKAATRRTKRELSLSHLARCRLRFAVSGFIYLSVPNLPRIAAAVKRIILIILMPKKPCKSGGMALYW